MSKVLDMGIESDGAVVSNKDELGVFASQNWSIPKRDPDSIDDGLQKFIPEKLNGSDCLDDTGIEMLSPGQVYKFERDDDDFRNCVIGDSGVGGCGFMVSVGYCDPMNTDAFTVVSGLATGGGTVMGRICGLAVVVCGLVTAVELFSVVECGFVTEGSARELWFVGSASEMDG